VQARIPPVPAEPARPAGFWARYAAWSLDAVILLPLVALLTAGKVGRALTDAQAAWDAIAKAVPGMLDAMLGGMQSPAGMARQLLLDPALADAAARLQSALGTLVLAPVVVYAVLALPWAVLFESSSWQATPGKRALGLRVTDAGGRRATTGRALQRHLAAGLSWLTLNIGHALALVPPAHLALHDRLSGTRVVRNAARASLAPWARAWLLLQAAAMVVGLGALFVWLQAAMQAAMQQAMGL